MRQPFGARRQVGFLVIAAVFLLVVLAGLVAYLTTVSTTSQSASAADYNAARAYQAARAGIEWGTYQILVNPVGGTFKTACETGPGFTATRHLTFGSTLSPFTASVTCTSVSITEGAAAVISYSIVSNGCNEPTGGASCPNSASTSTTYVERELRLAIAN